MKLSDLPTLEKPREKALHFGISSLSNAELLGIILRIGDKGKSAIELGYDVINYFGGIDKLPAASLDSLMKIKGIREAKAISLLAICEFAKRINYQKNILQPLNSVEDVYRLYEPILANEPQEKCLALLLNTKNCLIKSIEISKGSLTTHLIHARDIFRDAIKENSYKIILIHNHPSGDCTPSSNDIKTTLALAKFGQELGICIDDHIIIAKGSFFSMRRNNII